MRTKIDEELESYLPEIRAAARRLHRPFRFMRVDAEDLAAEGLAGAWRALGTWDEGFGKSRRSWALGKARYAMLDWLRVELGRPGQPGTVARAAMARGDRVTSSLPSSDIESEGGATEADRWASREDALGLAEAAIQTLSPRRAETIRLRYVEEKSARETAEQLGVSVHAVRAATKKGLDDLRDNPRLEKAYRELEGAK